MRLFGITGEMGVGKDTLMQEVQRRHSNVVCLSFKQYLYEQLSIMYRVPLERVISLCTDRLLKELPCDEFEGQTPRYALIDLSENRLKKQYGRAIIAIETYYKISQIPQLNDKIVLLDGGFAHEFGTVRRRLLVDEQKGILQLEQFEIVELTRPGVRGTRTDDSRKHAVQPTATIENNSTREKLYWAFINAVKK